MNIRPYAAIVKLLLCLLALLASMAVFWGNGFSHPNGISSNHTSAARLKSSTM